MSSQFITKFIISMINSDKNSHIYLNKNTTQLLKKVTKSTREA